MNQVTSASLRYPLSVFNKNSTLKSADILASHVVVFCWCQLRKIDYSYTNGEIALLSPGSSESFARFLVLFHTNLQKTFMCRVGCVGEITVTIVSKKLSDRDLKPTRTEANE